MGRFQRVHRQVVDRLVVGMSQPASVMLPPVPVGTATADALAEIAWLEGQTVSYVVRRALEGYAGGYLARIRAMQQDHDSGPSTN